MNRLLALKLSAATQSTRLALEPLCARHAAAFFVPLQADAIYKWISMHKPTDVEQLQEHWLKIESRLAPDGQTAWATWAVRRKLDDRYIGRVDAEIDDALVAVNFGYYFFPEYWGQGIATEAVECAARHLELHGVRRLIATVTVGNKASVRVLEKTGFVFSRILADNDTIGGVVVDDLEYVRAME